MKAVCVIFCVCLLAMASSRAAAAQQHDGLANLYENIIADFANGTPPKLADVTDYLDKVPSMQVGEIRSALPWIQRAVQSPRLEVRSYGQLGLFAINQRPDSEALIGYLVPVIAANLNDPDRHIRSGAILVLAGMKPKPPEDAISHLLQALQSDQELGPGIVFALVQIDPNRDDIASAIDRYMTSQKLTTSQKVDTLNALATRQVQDKRLLDDIATNLTEQSDDVRISAMHAIRRSGPTGVAVAKSQLQSLAGSNQVSERVRSEAKQVLGEP